MNNVRWCDPGWYGVRYGFCPSQKAWAREMKRLRVESPPPYPQSDGRCSMFQTEKGPTVVLVTIGEHIDNRDPIGIVGVIVHEATHVWQYIKRDIGENAPGSECEAYAMQVISQELIDAYSRTRVNAGASDG